MRCCFQAAALSDLAFSSLASHSSILALTAEEEGSIKPNSSMEEDASHSPSAVREDITTTADFPLQLPLL